MALVVIPSTVKLALNGVCYGQQVVNILHYKYTGSSPNSSTLLTFINAWLTAHLTQWNNVHSNEYLLRELVATDIGIANGAQATLALSSGNVGSIGTQAFPNNVAVAISWRTSLSGRRNRGRSFMGGIPGSAVDNDQVQASFLSALSILAIALIGQTFTGGYDLAVGSRSDLLAKVVTGFVLEALSDSMRTRLSGRGS